jgi:hypothetical protein
LLLLLLPLLDRLLLPRLDRLLRLDLLPWHNRHCGFLVVRPSKRQRDYQDQDRGQRVQDFSVGHV